MVQDLSYLRNLASAPTDEQEAAVVKAIEKECFKAIAAYLKQVADMMESKGIETLNVATMQAMAQEMNTRAEDYNENENN